MTIQKTLTIQVSMSSGASEADLNQHLDDFVNEIKYDCENMLLRSRYQSINTSWDESYRVQISLKNSVK
jgi:hypothetical protein